MLNVNRNIKILSLYTHSRDKVNCKCAICGFLFKATPDNLLHNHGCKQCDSIRKREIFSNTQEDFETVAYEIWGDDYAIIGEYTNNHTHINIKHKICGGTYKTTLLNIQSGTKCPYCSGRKALKGYNDMWITNPLKASLLHDSADGHRFLNYSEKQAKFKCPNCGDVSLKRVSDVNANKYSCRICGDGFSYPERLFTCLLNSGNIKYEQHIKFDWSENKQYDFLSTMTLYAKLWASNIIKTRLAKLAVEI